MQTLQHITTAQTTTPTNSYAARASIRALTPYLVKLDTGITRRNNQATLLPRTTSRPDIPLSRPATTSSPPIDPCPPLLHLPTLTSALGPTREPHRPKRPLLSDPGYPHHKIATRPREHRNAVRMLRLGESKRRRDLPAVRRLDERRHLCAAVDGRELRPGDRVVEVDAAVVAAGAEGEEGWCPGRVGEGFDCCVEGDGVGRRRGGE